MKRWIVRAVIVLAFVGLGAYLNYWIFTPNPIPVFVMDVERGRVEETVSRELLSKVVLESLLTRRPSPWVFLRSHQ